MWIIDLFFLLVNFSSSSPVMGYLLFCKTFVNPRRIPKPVPKVPHHLFSRLLYPMCFAFFTVRRQWNEIRQRRQLWRKFRIWPYMRQTHHGFAKYPMCFAFFIVGRQWNEIWLVHRHESHHRRRRHQQQRRRRRHKVSREPETFERRRELVGAHVFGVAECFTQFEVSLWSQRNLHFDERDLGTPFTWQISKKKKKESWIRRLTFILAWEIPCVCRRSEKYTLKFIWKTFMRSKSTSISKRTLIPRKISTKWQRQVSLAH